MNLEQSTRHLDDDTAIRAAGAAKDRLFVFYRKRFIEPELKAPRHVLFHYTTAEGLKGILEHNELWATSAYFLNDPTEVTYGFRILENALDDWVSEQPKRRNSQCHEFAAHFQTSFRSILASGSYEPIYLVSLCEDGNLLSQWRAYGQSGYSCGFEAGTSRLQPEFANFTARWVKVNYQETQQVAACKLILDLIESISDEAAQAWKNPRAASHGIVGLSGIYRPMVDMLLEEIVGFKPQAFASENEWRIVVRRRDLYKQGNDSNRVDPSHVHFRLSHGMITPYVKIVPQPPGDKLPLKSVCSGPALIRGVSEMAVRMMLEKHKFANVEVSESEISLRF